MRNGGVSLWLVLVLFAACEQSAAKLLAPPLRVASLPGLDLTTFEPSEHPAGSIGPALDLAYDYISEHATIASHRDRVVVLELGSNSRYTIDEIAARLDFRGLSSAEVIGSRVHAVFESLERAEAFVVSGAGGIRNGQFVATSTDPFPGFTLVSHQPPYEIVPITADWHVHWQLLLGGHVDVIPFMRGTEIRWLENETGVRIFETASRFFALQLNSDRLTIDQRRLLQALVVQMKPYRALCPQKAGCGARLPALESADPTPRSEASLDGLRILAIDQAQEEQLGVRAIANAIWRATGTRPEVVFASMEEASELYVSRDYSVFLMPFSTKPQEFYSSLLPGQRRGLAGSVNAKLVEAVQIHDWSRAATIVHDEALVVPAWTATYYAAMATGTWCAPEDLTPAADSWKWIARLRSCDGQ